MPFASKSGYLDQQGIDMLRSVLDELVIENGISVETQEYARLAETVINLYLSGTIDADDLKRMASMPQAA